MLQERLKNDIFLKKIHYIYWYYFAKNTFS